MKYELIESDRPHLYRIRALKDFSDVKKGDIGGYVSKLYNEAQMFDNSKMAFLLGTLKYNQHLAKPTIQIISERNFVFLCLDGIITAGCRYLTYKKAKEHWKLKPELGIIKSLKKMLPR